MCCWLFYVWCFILVSGDRIVDLKLSLNGVWICWSKSSSSSFITNSSIASSSLDHIFMLDMFPNNPRCFVGPKLGSYWSGERRRWRWNRRRNLYGLCECLILISRFGHLFRLFHVFDDKFVSLRSVPQNFPSDLLILILLWKHHLYLQCNPQSPLMISKLRKSSKGQRLYRVCRLRH